MAPLSGHRVARGPCCSAQAGTGAKKTPLHFTEQSHPTLWVHSPCLLLAPCAKGMGNRVIQHCTHVTELTSQYLGQLLTFKRVPILGALKLWCQLLTAGPCW